MQFNWSEDLTIICMFHASIIDVSAYNAYYDKTACSSINEMFPKYILHYKVIVMM